MRIFIPSNGGEVIFFFLTALCLTGCSKNQDVDPLKVLSQAQTQIKALSYSEDYKKTAQIMPSYFLELEYEVSQKKLTNTQSNRVKKFLLKPDYIDEYTLYLTLGLNTTKSKTEALSKAYSRAVELKQRYLGELKKIEIAFLSSQKIDTAYFRFIA